MIRRRVSVLIAGALIASAVPAASPPSAAAIPNPLAAVCGGVGALSGVLGKACSLAGHAGRVLRAGGRLLHGRVGGAAKALLGNSGGVARDAAAAAGLAAAGVWAAHGAQAALREAARVIGRTTAPHLTSAWFSVTYWRVAGLSALLTVPFLFAAAIHSLVRSDPTLLARAAFGYLPLSLLAVSIAAPLTMLLLAASDQMSAVVEGAAGDGGGRFLTLLAGSAAIGAPFGSTFLALLIGVVMVLAALMLTLELLMRAAAVYVVVLMLPLAFASLVWPARRIWAIRMVELLVALILSKFVIVAVLALAEGALGQLAGDGVGTVLAGMALLLLAAFSPWVLLRLLPFAEVGAGIGGALRGEPARLGGAVRQAHGVDAVLAEHDAGAWIRDTVGRMGRDAGGHATEPDHEDPLPAGTTNGSPPPGAPAPGASAPGSPAAGAPDPSDPADPAAASSAAGASPVTGSAWPQDGGERLPGDEPHWQQEDGAWPPIRLGPEPEPEPPSPEPPSPEPPSPEPPSPEPPPPEPEL